MFALIVFLVASSSEAPSTSRVAWIDVASNIGNASGGHSALLVDNDVYHYQRAPGGALHLVRDSWNRFRFLYNNVENRTLTLAVLDLDAALLASIEEAFARAFVAQQSRRDRLHRLARDLVWADALRSGLPPPPLRMAGLFTRLDKGSKHARERKASVDAKRRWKPTPPVRETSSLSAWREGLAEREAHLVLKEARAVDPRLQVIGPALTPGAHQSLELWKEHLRQRTYALLESSRPDRGFALLLAMARHQVVARSLEEGRLITLDPFPMDARWSDAEELGGHSVLQTLTRQADNVHTELMQSILDGQSITEAQYNLLEESAGRLQELRNGLQGRAFRVGAHGPIERLIPCRGRVVSLDEAEPPSDSVVAQLIREYDRHKKSFDQTYRYDVFKHNCVNELARTLQEGLHASNGDVALQEHVFDFIPSVQFDLLRASLPIARIETHLSLRHRLVQERYETEPDARVYLTEFNTLTSTTYAPRAEDGAFLLFCDDEPWTRPLYGTVNLVYGLGYALLGLPYAPFDGGQTTMTGWRGAMYSLPELFFLGIRKGTYPSRDVPRSGVGVNTPSTSSDGTTASK